MNNESQLENSDFSDGYLLVEDNPKKNKNSRAADLYYNESAAPLTIEELDSFEFSEKSSQPALPKLKDPDKPVFESLDGIEMSVRDSLAESEERAAENVALNNKYKHEKTDFYKDKKYFDDLILREHGEKIARVIGIDLIIISLIAAVNSFFTGNGMDFIVSLIRIAFTVMFMLGYKVARWFLMFTVAVSIYGPFVLLFVSDHEKTPAQIIIYSVVLAMYTLIEIILVKNKDVKEFCTKTFF